MSLIPRLLPATDHGTEIGLLAIIATGILILVGIGLHNAAPDSPFDPSAYLVVLTLIVGAIKERWLSRSVDKMGQKLADSSPANDNTAVPESAAEAADQTARAATDEADKIGRKAK